MEDVRGTTGQWMANAAVETLLNRLLRQPYPDRVARMGRLMSRWIGPVAGYRRRAEDQLRWIYPEKPASWHREIAAAALDSSGRTLIELYSGEEFTSHAARQPLGGAGLPIVEKARADGRPVLFVTGHFGNHEAARHALVSKGFQIGGLYRPMKNPYFNARYAQTMTTVSGPVLAQGRSGSTGFARRLKQGGMMTLLFDVWVGEGELIPFLGQDAPTSLAAAELALRYDALMVPYFATRQADGLGFEIEIEEPIEPSDAITMTRAATERLEVRVRTHPDQWFWPHRRWKPERRAG